ncbi:hypothetical protein FB567DRAFT_587640 [Paraphoma chrysanthemicola]|uniref:Uncharacterized protein n=1 Tax=Paraphoma chrysanthemicola TaxID=798071 RepID=A0A8K0W2J7_9PLEO|nr:hypothetical protein FB567DRAFT_587640 [Paraphoma chrysanthemicola]
MLSYTRVSLPSHLQFNLPLKSTLDTQVWRRIPSKEKAEYIEAFVSEKGDASAEDDPASRCRYGTLEDQEILEWVTQSGSYEPLKAPSGGKFTNGGIRLLILERAFYQPPSFDIDTETFLAIQKHFNLPEHTLLGLSDEAGLSVHTLEIDESNGTPLRLGMIMKASQKFQVGNYGLAFSHDFATGLSTGILHGTGITSYGDDHHLWNERAGAEIFELIKAARSSWNHALSLPAVIMQHHLLRADYFCTVVLANQFTDVQRDLGTARSGRLHNTQPRNLATDLPVPQAKINLRELTVSLSSLIHENTSCVTMSDWQCSCTKHLEEILKEMKSYRELRKSYISMLSKIRYLNSTAESVKRLNNNLREHGLADMNILYSIISQVDNRLSAKMAAASSRDSAAMKTLAFLTTLFLPGTFIATIFSTSMFDWQREPDKRVVSDLFWVYWVFTVPLTIIVALGWRVWWNWEKKKFDEDVNAELRAVDGDEDVSGAFGKEQQPPNLDWRLEYGSLSPPYAPSVMAPASIHLGARRRR